MGSCVHSSSRSGQAVTAARWPGVVETASAEEKQYALDRAINGLRDDHPMQSASRAVYGWQKQILIALLVALAGFAAWQPMNTAVALIGLCTLGYVLTMTDRVLIFKEGLASRPITIGDEMARAIPDEDLPRYTIYGSNGMSEAPFVFLITWSVRRLILWMVDDDVHHLIVAGGIAMALAYLTRYYAVGTVAAAGFLVGITTYCAPGRRRGCAAQSWTFFS